MNENGNKRGREVKVGNRKVRRKSTGKRMVNVQKRSTEREEGVPETVTSAGW